jgi:hypothetical protein
MEHVSQYAPIFDGPTLVRLAPDANDGLRREVAELAERLAFAERSLVRRSEPEALPRGG